MTGFGYLHGIVLMAETVREDTLCNPVEPLEKILFVFDRLQEIIGTFQNNCMLRFLLVRFLDTFINESKRPVGAEKEETAVSVATCQKFELLF